ncbi:MAG TPA: ATP-binding protein [Cyclobacteriaceae bacterium]|nr:GHKL domain-containing protein [Cyclobacteriaceae bacterium]HRK53487.1 ATP-binding protein [Cyclobacteriaceae bacterium]
MGFNLRSPLVTRIAILVATVFAMAYAVAGSFNIIIILALTGATLFQISHLIKEFEESNENIASFLDAIRFDDLSSSFKTDSDDPAVQRLHKELNEAITKLKTSRSEKDSEYQFFKNIVQHVGIGLLTFKKDGSIQIMNTAAKKLLRVNNAKHIDDLRTVSDVLVEAFLKLKTGGRELARLVLADETIQVSIYAIELTLRGEVIKLISINNIQSELDEKEMEAWQNLVRVLTHEIMNSVTPISSLAGVVEDDLKSKMEQPVATFNKEEMNDMHLSIQTISRRSAGLIHFVKEFKNLSQRPQPNLAPVKVKKLLEEMAVLQKKELIDNKVKIEISIEPDDLMISADKSMIEQVIINLVKNAIQSFSEQEEKIIQLKAYLDEKTRPIISVSDNGDGIDPEALERIFVPFYSTKKAGSGIGLSLSKQIMRQHEGRITVKSKLGEGTEFMLRF